MPRRCYDFLIPEKNPRKKSSNGLGKINIEQGEVLIDLNEKKWKLGKALASGGFGDIFEVVDVKSDNKTNVLSNVVKLEPHSNGPLFVEVNCYLRIAKLEMIEEWKQKHDLDFLGMPHYIASGSHYYKDEKYRFLVLPKYETDLEQILKEKKVFNIKTVLTVSIQMLHVLEYIHSKGYVHCDIKASNIMIGKRHKKVEKIPRKTIQRRPLRAAVRNTRKVRQTIRNLRPLQDISYIDDIPYLEDMLNSPINMYNDKNEISSIKNCDDSNFDEVYLLDFGLASKYLLSDGHHRDFTTDERRAHAGTMLFCSRDAHQGMISRRSDVESLGYNIIYWLTGQLPWSEDLEQPERIAEKKNKGFKKLNIFLKYCFNDDCPNFVLEYFKYIETLEFKDCPDYGYCRGLFEAAMDIYGLNKDLVLDFENVDDWKIPKKKQKLSNNNENELKTFTFLMHSPLRPLSSNIIFKRPKLRKKIKNVKIQDSMMNWSKILTDPEIIIKQARDKKSLDEEELCDLSLLDIKSMNPTDSMLDIYNKSTGNIKKVLRLPQNIDGFTTAMMKVYVKMTKGKKRDNKTKLRITYRSCGRNGERRERRRSKRSASPVTRMSRLA